MQRLEHKKIVSACIFGLTLCLSLSSCAYQDTITPWLVGVYMAADVADLHVVALGDLQEMQNANTEEIEVVALVDRFQYSYGSKTDPREWADTRAYRISEGEQEEIAIAKLGLTLGAQEELDMGSESNLEGFVSYLHEQYPHHKKLFVLWGHGDGYRSFGNDATRNVFRGIAIDRGGSSETRLRIGNIGNVFTRYPVDMLALDACIGANIELVYELRHTNSVLLVSQEDVPIAGWDYEGVLEAMSTSNRGVLGISQAIVQEYDRLYPDSFPYAAILPNKSKDFARNWNALITALDGILDDTNRMALQNMLLTRGLLFPKIGITNISNDQSIDVHMDIHHFLKRLSESTLIASFTEKEKELISTLQREIEAMVLVKKPDSESDPQGVSIYLGNLQSDNRVLYTGMYSASDKDASLFVRETSWNEEGFLRRVFSY